MKKTLFLILFAALAFGARAQEFQKIQDGIEYAQFKRAIKPNEKEKATETVVNALRLDLKRARLDVVHAMDAAIGVERVSSIAARHNAVAAVNAGFFRIKDDIFKGDPTGVLQIDGNLLSESFGDRIALFIKNSENKTEINIGNLSVSRHLRLPEGRAAYPARDIGTNRERGADDIVIYTPAFHSTTLTNSEGIEVIVKNNIVANVVRNKGSNQIPIDGFVLSASGKSVSDVLAVAEVGKKIDVFTAQTSILANDRFVSSDYFHKAEDIVGGVPQLIKNGKIEITWEEEKIGKAFVETHHPRTAIAKLKDGRALLVTVDGRNEESGGMSLYELAEMLLEMGAVDAMNLDGGGSTTMFLNGKVVNHPSDKEGERPVSDAILVTLRK